MNQALDDYLGALAADWRDSLMTEPVEDWRAKAVVRQILENADWDQKARIIRFNTKDDRKMEITSRDNLEAELRTLCSDEWHNNAMKIDGEFVGKCDDRTWVSEALEAYDDQLKGFFNVPEEEEDDTPPPHPV